MEPKAYLLRYQEIVHQIEANALEAIRLRSLAEKCTVSFDTESGGTGDGQRIPRITEQLLRLEAQTEQLTHTLDAVRAEIIAVINAVPQHHHRELLRYRYLAGMPFEEIAVRMGYSYRQTIRLHGRSLQIVAGIIAQDTRDFDSGDV
ncbi:MAG: hypothetical protein ACI4J3_07525 [Oscillospiraceae bacterium]